MQQPFDMQQLIRMSQSPAGQQLMKTLKKKSGGDLEKAAALASAGDLESAKKALSSILESPDLQKLLQQLEEQL